MTVLFAVLRCAKPIMAVTVCAAAAACASPSYQAEALRASDSGDQKTAISLATKEVARFSTPDQCSPGTNTNCGTLALAYSSLAEYQILAGDRAGAESSFSSAKKALAWMNREDRPGAAGMVYHDVSEAFWKVGDKARAIAVFKEGRAAGGDSWLTFASAAQAAGQGRAEAR